MDDFTKIKDAFYKVQCLNWIKNRGYGPSAAGKTLENILGKEDDINSLPDYYGVELKTKIDGSDPLVGLLSMAPDSEPLLINRILNNYGWPSRKNLNFKVFFGSVYGNAFNDIGIFYSFKLHVDYARKEVRLLIRNKTTFEINNTIGWSFEQLSYRLSKKLKLLAFINVKRFYVKENDAVYFKYYKMTLYRLKDFSYFLKAIENGYIRLNIKIDFYDKPGFYYGRIHNKGTTFEIKYENFSEIFEDQDGC